MRTGPGLDSRGSAGDDAGVRRSLLPALLAAWALSAAGAVGAPAAAAAGTRILKVSPTTAEGVLAPAYAIGQSVARAHCEAGSDVLAGVYRCFAGNEVLDPCWAESGAAPAVLCLPAPWSHEVIRLALQAPLETSPPGPLEVWGVRLASGQRCLAAQGAHGLISARVVDYECPDRLVLVGQPDRGHAEWRIREAHVTHGGGRLGSVVGITTAWYGLASSTPGSPGAAT